MRDCRPILLVEDDRVDAETTKRALNELKVANELIHKANGKDALEYLRDEDNIRPCVVLLDLNMPGMDGFEFLDIVKRDEELKSIPVIILTACDADHSVVKAFGLAAAGYVVKPTEYQEFLDAIRTVDRYWTMSRLPDPDV